MIKILLSTPGSNSSLTSVYIDGYYQEPADVAALFGVSSYHHRSISKENGKISQHYKYSMKMTFDKHPVRVFITKTI
jgi:beta-1,2-N-acetylglucosaminyltransferase